MWFNCVYMTMGNLCFRNKLIDWLKSAVGNLSFQSSFIQWAWSTGVEELINETMLIKQYDVDFSYTLNSPSLSVCLSVSLSVCSMLACNSRTGDVENVNLLCGMHVISISQREWEFIYYSLWNVSNRKLIKPPRSQSFTRSATKCATVGHKVFRLGADVAAIKYHGVHNLHS